MTAKKALLTAIFISLMVSAAQARGRRPDDDDDRADNFPDYNRLEMHPKKKEAPAPAEEAPPPPPPSTRPSLNQPADFSSEGDDKPRPAPAAVPVPPGASEPPLPDDMMGTLDPQTSTQMPSPK